MRCINLYMTTKGVQIKFLNLHAPSPAQRILRPSSSDKGKRNLTQGRSFPFMHDDLANGTCYHYVVTVVTQKAFKPRSRHLAPHLTADSTR